MRNIQNIQNSLDTGHLESNNMEDDPDPDICNDCEEEENYTWDCFQAEVSSYFQRKQCHQLTSEPIQFSIKISPELEEVQHEIGQFENETPCICVYANTSECQSQTKGISYPHYCSKTNGEVLNRILKSTFLFQNGNQTSIKCTGSVKSIIQYALEKIRFRTKSSISSSGIHSCVDFY